MAVFPDHIVQKNSADDEATIIAAIEVGGSDEIHQGEMLIGFEGTGATATATIYTRNTTNEIVKISGGGGGGGGGYGRGDGGDFDAGEVGTGFNTGIFGGGDVTATAIMYPAEQFGGFDPGTA